MSAALGRHLDQILDRLPAGRLLGLDVLRGLTITAMILVNNPGSWSHIYAPLRHAAWHGWTPTDLVFPFFVFIMGVSITLSLPRQQAKGIPSQRLLGDAAIRALKLCGLGWFLALFYFNFQAESYDWVAQRLEGIRVMGVLQRLGLVYLFTVALVLWLPRRTLLPVALALLLGYGLAMNLWPYADDAGIQYQGLWLHGNSLAAWVDHQLLGPVHSYYGQAVPFAFDPEGLLSTLPAVASCLSGVVVGFALGHQPLARLKSLAGVGLALALVGQGMHVLWPEALPINKALWTPSYVALSSGLAMVALALCLALTDLWGRRRWAAPFLVFGANAIAFFMFAGVMGRLLIMLPVGDSHLKAWLYSHLFQPALGNLNGSLAFALTFLALSYGVMHGLYRRGLFWKV